MMPISKRLRHFTLAIVCTGITLVTYPELSESRNTADHETTEQLRYLGQQVHHQLIDAGRLYRDVDLERYLHEVLSRAVDQNQGGRVYVIADTSPNAFVSPNGYIYLHLGLLLRIHDEAELALVLAHEAAHIELQHPEALLKNQPSSTQKLVSKVPVLGKIFYAGKQIGFGPELEFAADKAALKYISNAGYGSGAALRLYRRLALEVPVTVSEIRHRPASTHPLIAERLERFDSLLDEAQSGLTTDQHVERYRTQTMAARVEALCQLLELREATTLIMLLEREPTFYDAYHGYFLAAAQRITGTKRPESMIGALRRTLSALPEYPPAYRLLGQLQLDVLDFRSAQLAFLTYLDLAPAAPDAAAIRAQLAAIAR